VYTHTHIYIKAMIRQFEGETDEQFVKRVWNTGTCDKCHQEIHDTKSVWVLDDMREETHKLYEYPVEYDSKRFLEHLDNKVVAINYCFCSEECALQDIDSTKDHCDWCHAVVKYDNDPHMVSDDMEKVMPFDSDDFSKIKNILTFCSLRCAESYVTYS